jgi:NAD(P)-dependent dehydrogenase (short-subunit alcohol dehydrogenase family)
MHTLETNSSRRHFLASLATGAAALGLGTTTFAQDKTSSALPRRFAGKVVLVTGGTSGIGEGAVRAFAAEGARVVFCGRRAELGEKVAASIRAAGGEAHFVRADVAKETDVAALVAATLEKYGRLDCAFNNAGIDRPPAPIETTDSAQFAELININATGVFYSMKHEIPALLAAGGGAAIVNMASIGAHKGFANIIGYSASKVAVLSMTRTAAAELGPRGIRVNAVSPGPIKTPMMQRVYEQWKVTPEQIAAGYPLRRIGRAEEVVRLVLWLCSDEASYVHGADVAVDAGARAT